MKIKKIVLMLSFLYGYGACAAALIQENESDIQELAVESIEVENINKTNALGETKKTFEGEKKIKAQNQKGAKDVKWKGPATLDHFREVLSELKSKKILTAQELRDRDEALQKAKEYLDDRKINDPSWNNQRNQVVLVVDVTPNKHILHVSFWDGKVLLPLESFAVSGGGTPRREHFYSPPGWHVKKGNIIDFRAEGTPNGNGIRGYGLKGSRIWDFGWIEAQSSWRKNLNIPIRFQMHATDPVLEARFGKEASKGCIRIPQDLNRILDGSGALDYQYLQERNKAQQWILGGHEKLKEAGDVLVVVRRQNDTKEKTVEEGASPGLEKS